MIGLNRRVYTGCLIAAAWTFGAGVVAQAQATSLHSQATDHPSGEVEFRIEAQPIREALKQFASQSGIQLVYETELLQPDARCPQVTGSLTPQAALSRLLAHTNLQYKFVNDRTVSIRSSSGAEGASESRAAQPASPGAPTSSSTAALPLTSDRRDNGQTQPIEPPRKTSGKGAGMEEVVVTAEKRNERLQDVPVPVTAISADSLLENNQPRLQDYYSNIPGFILAPSAGQGNAQTIAIRGIVAGSFTNPTVGITVDDVPYGSSIKILGNVVPDVDPSDLERIEVLRGPQGTLYGASSMGGLLKFVTVDPSTSGIFGRAQADVNEVHNGSGAGYSFRGAVNLPLSDDFAMRASAFTRRDPGYITNPVLGVDGVNSDRVYGGRLSALWRPSSNFSLKLSALYQDTKGDGLSDVIIQPGLGDLQQNYARFVGPWDKQIQAYSALLTGELGPVQLTAISGYNVNKWSNSIDISAFGGFFGFRGDSVPLLSAGTTDKFTQEVRAEIPLGNSLHWLVGGFFTHENSPNTESAPVLNPNNGASLGSLGMSSSPSTYTEYAAFTDLTVNFTDRFDVQLGGRESHIKQRFETVNEAGPLFIGGGATIPEADTTANAFTYLFTPRLKLSPDMMVYARFASGYRPGGSNNFNPDPNIPRAYAPDKTLNYEVGLKGDALDHNLTFDASVYYIDWKNIQLTLHDFSDNLGYGTNGSRAKSEGVELSARANPVAGLTLAAWATYDDAVLTESFPTDPTLYGVDGNRLPYSPRFSANVSIDQSIPLGADLAAYAGVTVGYIGDRLGVFTASVKRQVYPAYTDADLRTGIIYDSWKVNIYVNNVTDKRGMIGGGLGTSLNPNIFYFIQPRTVGLSVIKSF